MATGSGESVIAGDRRHPVGILRREFLQVGFSGLLGMGLPDLLALRGRAAAASPGGSKAKPALGRCRGRNR